ncbi:MAG: alanine dehydrogenase [Chitinophagales bacterium]|nr:alanine dehydrogenase [Chitinophagales bacterium]
MEAVLEQIKKEFALTPQEALAQISFIKKSLQIGLPKEDALKERRIALTPNSVATLTNQGHKIILEAGAGEGAHFSDDEYTLAGAQLSGSKEEVYQSDLVFKTAPVLSEDINYLKNGQCIFSPISVSVMNKNVIKTLMQKRVTAIAYGYIQSDDKYLPYMETTGEIVGAYSIVLAAKYLSSEFGKGLLLGGVAGQPPCKVLILGAGKVGLTAAKTAIGMGAQVFIFDNNIRTLSHAREQLGHNIYTSVVDTINLKKNIARADIVIGALTYEEFEVPQIVTSSMVKQMKKGAVLIDTCIDRGGCFETSKVTTLDQPTFVQDGVIHYCVPNISSNIARTATYTLSNFLTPLVAKMGQKGGVEQLIKSDVFFRNGVYLYKGMLTQQQLASKHGLKYTDLNLILTADF